MSYHTVSCPMDNDLLAAIAGSHNRTGYAPGAHSLRRYLGQDSTLRKLTRHIMLGALGDARALKLVPEGLGAYCLGIEAGECMPQVFIYARLCRIPVAVPQAQDM